MTDPEALDALVVGGGLAGLCAAHRLRSEGFRVGLFEAGREPGGNVRTAEVDGFLLELGPHALPGSAHEVFDLAAPELMRVARHLCRDESEAEDAVQATFLTALVKPVD